MVNAGTLRTTGNRWRRWSGVGLAWCALGSCSDLVSVPKGSLPVPDLASDWLGDYLGTGQGMVDGQPAFIAEAELTIGYDAGENVSPGCPGCVTVRLDDDFFLPNVVVDHTTDLSLSYRDGVVLYTLLMHRPLLGVESTKLLEARLTIGNHDAPSPIVDLEFFLERP